MSSSGSSSSSPEPASLREISKKSTGKKKTTKEAQAASAVDPHGKDEGKNPNWDYKPPEGYKPMNLKVDDSPFDWDTIKDDDNLELWVVRVPDSLKPKYLQEAKLESSSSPSKTARIGSIDRKSTTYDVWNLGEDEADAIGGEELLGVSALLPRSKHSGKLFQAPKPIARRLVVSARPTLPTPQSSPEPHVISHENPPRPTYSKDLLTHRFMPLGSLAPVEDDATMDVDVPPAIQPSKSLKESAKKGKEDGEAPKKKRKSALDSPKKPKKPKAAS
ncbi:hypothetical protein C2E23DRAFT_865355 [Lenzites betulinus]|nr:hypothetical protein C2E23DRAFT_865355 [Lenzites betulinus]